jgi:hypothetical protein
MLPKSPKKKKKLGAVRMGMLNWLWLDLCKQGNGLTFRQLKMFTFKSSQAKWKRLWRLYSTYSIKGRNRIALEIYNCKQSILCV